jgi:hypothetical protein
MGVSVVVVPEFRRTENPTFSTASAGSSHPNVPTKLFNALKNEWENDYKRKKASGFLRKPIWNVESRATKPV